jgi:N-methylhydantoinase B
VVARGSVSAAAAETLYGFVLRDGEVAVAATAALRGAQVPHRGHFHFGPERECYEAQWTRDAYAALTAILAGLPIHWRFFTKTEIFRRMKGRAGAQGVAQSFAEARARFPNLPAPATTIREAAE